MITLGFAGGGARCGSLTLTVFLSIQAGSLELMPTRLCLGPDRWEGHPSTLKGCIHCFVSTTFAFLWWRALGSESMWRQKCMSGPDKPAFLRRRWADVDQFDGHDFSVNSGLLSFAGHWSAEPEWLPSLKVCKRLRKSTHCHGNDSWTCSNVELCSPVMTCTGLRVDVGTKVHLWPWQARTTEEKIYWFWLKIRIGINTTPGFRWDVCRHSSLTVQVNVADSRCRIRREKVVLGSRWITWRS